MANPSENDEQNWRQSAIYAKLPLAGADSPFSDLSAKDLLVLTDIFGFCTSVAKSKSTSENVVLPETVIDYRSRDTIAERTGQSVAAVTRHLKKLVDEKYITPFGRTLQRTAKRVLTKKTIFAFAKAETIPVPLALLEQMNFAEVYVLSYLAWKAGVFAKSEEFAKGFINQSYSAIADKLGIARKTVHVVINKLVLENWFQRELLKGKRGSRDLRLTRTSVQECAGWNLFPNADRPLTSVTNGDIYSPEAPGSSVTNRAVYPSEAALSSVTNRAVSVSQSEPSSVTNRATREYPYISTGHEYSLRSAPPLGAAETGYAQEPDQTHHLAEPSTSTIDHPAEQKPMSEKRTKTKLPAAEINAQLKETCRAISSRRANLCFDPAHAEWFLKIRITAAHVELHEKQSLSETKAHFCPASGIAPLYSNLQSTLLCAYSAANKKQSPESEFRKWLKNLRPAFPTETLDLFTKSSSARLIEKRLPEILKTIQEMSSAPVVPSMVETEAQPGLKDSAVSETDTDFETTAEPKSENCIRSCDPHDPLDFCPADDHVTTPQEIQVAYEAAVCFVESLVAPSNSEVDLPMAVLPPSAA